jgi:hypothetical protein
VLVRFRKEVQEVSRSLSVILLAAPLAAAVLPERAGPWLKSAGKPLAPADAELFAEYGFQEGEEAALGPFRIRAWRFRDSTGGFAGFQALRPENAGKSRLPGLAATIPGGLLALAGNYVLEFRGRVPTAAEWDTLTASLPRRDRTPLPGLSAYLPPAGLIANSERYVLGPVSLSRFAAEVPTEAAGFAVGAEAQVARYQTAKGPMSLVIFSYPTNGIARSQLAVLERISGVLAKRTNALVGLIPQPADPEAAGKILALVTQDLSITWNDVPPPQPTVQDAAKMIYAIIQLAGLLLGICLIAGLAMAGFFLYLRRSAAAQPGGEFTSLRLRDE